MADGEDVLVIKGQRIVLPDSIISGCVVVKNGKIVGIEAGYSAISAPLGAKV